MTNGNYTVFGLKAGEPAWKESLVCDTPDVKKYEAAVRQAKKEGYKITRVYKPDTILSQPNFAAAVSV